MIEPPDENNLDQFASGFYALSKSLRIEDCPKAMGTIAHAQWTARYDAALNKGEQSA